MNIQLKQFGRTLTSRNSGKEAFNAIKPLLSANKPDELFIDFDGVGTFSPSWGDEFLTLLRDQYKGKIILLNTENASVTATLDLLSELNDISFNIK